MKLILGKQPVEKGKKEKKDSKRIVERATAPVEQVTAPVVDKQESAPTSEQKKPMTMPRGRVRDEVCEQRKFLYEDIARRELNGKHYVSNNGTVTAVYQNSAIHYVDPEDNSLKNVDNTLIDTGEAFETAANSFKTRFSKHAKDGKVFEMSKGLHKVALFSREAKEKGGCMLENCSCAEHRNISEVILKEIKDNTDLQYIVDSQKVKENIIIHEKADIYEYNFDLMIENMTVGVSKDNKILELRSKETGEVQFTIPGPFMTDAKSNYSDRVYYEIGYQSDDLLTLKVVPDEKWINAEDRAFPVTIDPQIDSGRNQALFIVEAYERDLDSYGNQGEWTKLSNNSVSMNIGVLGTKESKVVIKIPKELLGVPFNKIINAKLELWANPGGNCKVNGKTTSIHSYEPFDITNAFSQDKNFATIELTAIDKNNVSIILYNSYEFFGMILTVDYLQDFDTPIVKENFSLAGGMTGELVLGTGEFIPAFADVNAGSSVLPLQIMHSYKVSDADYGCGKNWRLNLNQRLVKHSGYQIGVETVNPEDDKVSWFYTDANGIKHGFNEIYYILEDGYKHTVDKISVSVHSNGKLIYTDCYGNEYEAFREFRSGTGLLLQTQYDGLKGVEFLEQRHEEVARVEEEIDQLNQTIAGLDFDIGEYKDQKKYVGPNYGFLGQSIIKERMEAVQKKIQELSIMTVTEVDAQTAKTNSLKAEPYNVTCSKTGCLQKTKCPQCESIAVNDKTVAEQSWNRQKQINSLQNYLQELTATYENSKEGGNGITANKIRRENRETAVYNYAILQREKYNKLLAQKTQQLKQLKRQIPTAYLIDEDNTALCFNCHGDLCAIADGCGNYVAIEYGEDYIQNDPESKALITGIYNGENKTALQYNLYGQLISITDPQGRRVTYDYNYGKDLTCVTFANGETVRFTYSAGNITEIVASDGTSTGISYQQQMLWSIGNSTDAISITDSGVTHGYPEALFSASVNYNDNHTRIWANGITTEYYLDFFGGLKGKHCTDLHNTISESLSYRYLTPDKSWMYSAAEQENAAQLLTPPADKNVNGEFEVATLTNIQNLAPGETEFVFSAIAIAQKSNETIRNSKTAFVSYEYGYSSYVTSKFELRAVVKYSDNDKETFVVPYDYRNDGRQLIMLPVTLRYNKPAHEIKLYAVYSGHGKTANFSGFRFAAGAWEFTQFDEFRNPIRKESSMALLGEKDGVYTYAKSYTPEGGLLYDEQNRLILKKPRTKFMKSDDGSCETSVCTVRKYAYSGQGRLIRTERYTEGEEGSSGIAIQETVYDDKGRVTKEISYNSLDSSAKFIAEKSYDENGTVTAEFSEDGTGKTVPLYQDGTGLVQSVNAPNGSVTAYGRDTDTDAGTAISQSDDSGEPNTNNIRYVNGLPTRLTSGLNTVHYAYDFKGRKTQVELNGKEHVSYRYEEYSAKVYQTDNKYISVDAVAATVHGATETDNVATQVVTDKRGNVRQVSVGEMKTNANGQIEPEYQTQFQNEYDERGRLRKSTDYVRGCVTRNQYNAVFKDRAESAERKNVSGKSELKEAYAYNDYGQIAGRNITGAVTQSYGYMYKANAARDLESVSLPNGLTYKPLSDVNGRSAGKILGDSSGNKFGEYLTYRKVGDRATGQISSVRYGRSAGGNYAIGDNLKYAYDASGNITHIRENGTITARYAYDKLNRLIREDNKKLGETVLFDYDNNGNILSKKTAPYSLSISTEHLTEFKDELYYGYDGNHPDQLVYCAGGELTAPMRIAYNAFGNPLTYGDKTLTWQNGRQLAGVAATNDPTQSVTFVYDGYGKQICKKPTFSEGADAQVVYTYDIGGKLVKQTTGNPVINALEFIYDGNGLSGVTHNGTPYIYRKNIQGDITHIYTLDGTLKACYTYDAWGNHKVVCYDENNIVVPSVIQSEVDGSQVEVSNPLLQTHIGNLNPFRYRSYLYDTETGLYFLKTRYYDPKIGRFISQDAVEYLDPETINGLNLYAYCGDNPVMNVDPNGTIFFSFLVCLGVMALKVAAKVLIGAIVTGIVCGLVNGSMNAITAFATGQDPFAALVGGFVNGAISGIGVGIGLAVGGIPGLIIAAGAGYAGGYIGNVVENGIATGTYDWSLKSNLGYGIIGAAVNVVTFGLSTIILKSLGELTGNFFKRLVQAFAPSLDGLMINGIYGGALALYTTLFGIIAYYATGGKYGEPHKTFA